MEECNSPRSVGSYTQNLGFFTLLRPLIGKPKFPAGGDRRGLRLTGYRSGATDLVLPTEVWLRDLGIWSTTTYRPSRSPAKSCRVLPSPPHPSVHAGEAFFVHAATVAWTLFSRGCRGLLRCVIRRRCCRWGCRHRCYLCLGGSRLPRPPTHGPPPTWITLEAI